LLKKLEEFGKFIVITGFRGAQIADIEKLIKTFRSKTDPNVEFQFFNAKIVASWEHLFFASLNALSAFKNGQNISKNLAVETLLYASAQRQIRKAMELLGLKKGITEIALLIIGEDVDKVKSALINIEKIVNAKRDDGILMISDEKIETILKSFKISDAEIKAVISQKGDLKEAVKDLIIERMALLAARR